MEFKNIYDDVKKEKELKEKLPSIIRAKAKERESIDVNKIDFSNWKNFFEYIDDFFIKPIRIDTYNAKIDKIKEHFFRGKEYFYNTPRCFKLCNTFTKEEKEKTESLRKRLNNYTLTVRGDEFSTANDAISYDSKYLEGVGYVTTILYDNDRVVVWYDGETEEEAFQAIITTYEIFRTRIHEWWFRDIYVENYKEIYPDEEYNLSIVYASLPLQSLKKYYGDELDEDLVKMFEDFVKLTTGQSYKYDFENNCFVKVKEKNL